MDRLLCWIFAVLGTTVIVLGGYTAQIYQERNQLIDDIVMAEEVSLGESEPEEIDSTEEFEWPEYDELLAGVPEFVELKTCKTGEIDLPLSVSDKTRAVLKNKCVKDKDYKDFKKKMVDDYADKTKVNEAGDRIDISDPNDFTMLRATLTYEMEQQHGGVGNFLESIFNLSEQEKRDARLKLLE